MHGMNNCPERFDLNLLVVFDAVARTGSVTGAAAVLALSQPAVSHALNRLREVVGDPLFVRSRNVLVPTPRAQTLIEPVRAIVEAARGVMARGAFDPGTSERVFRIGGSDYTMLVLVPALVRLLRAEAPGATVELMPIDPQTLASLESGDLDLAFWGTTLPGPPYLSRTLFLERFVGIVGRRHPLADKARLGRFTLDDYVAYPHAVTHFRISVQSAVDAALAQLGLARTIGFTSPNFASNVAAVRETDMVMAIPSRLATALGDGELITFELPFEVASPPYSLIWHRRTDADPGCSWLREMTAKACAEPAQRIEA
jgi:DNA-binding transcriptional LysR family regulator